MTVRNLDAVFAPRAVALAGASPKAGSVGRAMLANLRGAGFSGPIGLVNPVHGEVDGLKAAKSFAALEHPADLVVVTAPAPFVPEIVDQAGAAGARAAVVITLSGTGEAMSRATLAAARARGMRLVGPGCLGVQSPHVRLNASAADAASAGELALIAESGGVMASTVAWANARSIGFSGLVSLGESRDVDVDDLLDHFAVDRRTRAILLHINGVADARRFMSAARAAARIKPVVVVKSGWPEERRRRAASFAGELAGADAVASAAFRRAGLLEVRDLSELFAAAETLAHVPPLSGKRIAIASNSAALGALALERLEDLGGEAARMTDATLAEIGAVLPSQGRPGNPTDLCVDAGGGRYKAALDAALADEGVDASLAIHAPSSLSPAEPCAEAIAAAAAQARARRFPPKPVFAAFLGSEVGPRRTLEAGHVPFFRTPEAAIDGLMHLVRHVEAQASLLATPPSAPESFAPDVARARAAIAAGLSSGRPWLSPTDVAETLAAYGIAMLPQAMVATPEEAAEVSIALTGPRGAALKLVSPDIARASVGGLRLALDTPEAVAEAARSMLARVAERAPNARVDGFVVQPHVRPDDGQALYLGIGDDPAFGPFVAFGAGGGAVELRRDVAVALPPLHMGLARGLMDRTLAGRLLAGYEGRPEADRDSVALMLVKLAQLAVDLPEIREVEINPLVATPRGAIAFDARIRVAPAPPHRGLANPRLAIRPYPQVYESLIALKDGRRVAVRPIRPEDEPAVAAFFRGVEPEDLRQRFFTPMAEVPRAFVARLTQIDYARTFVLLAIDEAGGEVVGVAQLHADADVETGEYAIVLRRDRKGAGLGRSLMGALIAVARAEGLGAVTGEVLTENAAMLGLVRSLGFEVRPDPDDASVRKVSLGLSGEAR